MIFVHSGCHDWMYLVTVNCCVRTSQCGATCFHWLTFKCHLKVWMNDWCNWPQYKNIILVLAQELCVKYQRFQPLSVACVKETDSDKDRTHTHIHTDNLTGVWTHHEWEFRLLDSYANKRRKPQFPESGREVCVMWLLCWARGASRPRRWLMTWDGRWNWYDRSPLYSFPPARL